VYHLQTWRGLLSISLILLDLHRLLLPVDQQGHLQTLADHRKVDSFHQITTGFLPLTCLKREVSFPRNFLADPRTVLSFLLKMASFRPADPKMVGNSPHITPVMTASYHLVTQVTSFLLITQADLREVDNSPHTTLVDLTMADNSHLITLVDFQVDHFHQCITVLPHSISDHPTT